MIEYSNISDIINLYSVLADSYASNIVYCANRIKKILKDKKPDCLGKYKTKKTTISFIF